MEVSQKIHFNNKSHWTLTFGDPFADWKEAPGKLIPVLAHHGTAMKQAVGPENTWSKG